MKLSAIHASSTCRIAGAPCTTACSKSGTCVLEWFPHTIIRPTSATWTPVSAASWLKARLWSRRVIAVKLSGGRSGALLIAIKAFVFAGFPTTSTLTSRLATSFNARPCSVKIAPFASRRSLRSMPGPRGRLPTSIAMSASRNATFASSLATTPRRSGNAPSASSIITPSTAFIAGGISSSCRITG